MSLVRRIPSSLPVAAEYQCDTCGARTLVGGSMALPAGWTYWPKSHTDLCPVCTAALEIAEGRLL